MKKKKSILRFSKENLMALHFFMEGISFPVAVAAYDDQQKMKIQYLIRLVQDKEINRTYDLCSWCIGQNVDYQILFPVSILQLISNPVRTYDYMRLRRRLRIDNINQNRR